MAVLPTKQLTGTTAWVPICAAPGLGKIRRVDLSATNITAAFEYAAASTRINDALDGANTGILRNAYPVPAPPDPDSSVQLHYALMLTEGQALEIKAGVADSVAFSAEIQEMDAANA